MAERKFAWAPRAENVLIGKEIARIDAAEKATGRAKYTSDINTPGTLVARLLTCKHAHAKVTKLDLDAVKNMPGVKAVHAFKKVGDPIRWEGDVIAAVAAERVGQADDAIKAIPIEYEVLAHWVDEDDLKGAEAADANLAAADKRITAARPTTRGDVEAALKTAKVVHKGHYGIATISHMCLEPHGTHCEWKEGNLDVHHSTQNVSGTAGQFAQGVGIEEAKVTVTADFEGGGFGSKFAADEWGVACAKMSKEAGKPVRLMFDRATELKTPGTRPSAFMDVTIAADAEGKIIAWDSHHWGTSGPQGGGVNAAVIPYVFTEVPNKKVSQTSIKCNTGPNRAWRAPNHPQACALTQTAMDDVAAKLGMDSYDFFLKNLALVAPPGNAQAAYRAGIYADEMKVAAKEIDWKAKWHPHGKGEKGPVKRGLGMGFHTWGGGAGASTGTLKLNQDGSAEAIIGSQDIGTGTRTVIAQTIAETFGIPMASVKVTLGSNKYPKANASGGSTTVGSVTGLYRRASQTALWQIFDKVKEKYTLATADNLAAKGGNILNGNDKVCTWQQAVALLGPMGLSTTGTGGGMTNGDGLTSAQVGGVQMVDVSVDTETGLIRINKFVCVQDCGLIVNELTAKSQVLGALIMGIAFALTEERIMDNATGRYINADLENYKLPRIGDIGTLKVIMYQPDSEYARGVIGLGEPPVIAPGAAISNAVANATGVRVPVLPLTPKRVLDALKGGQLS